MAQDIVDHDGYISVYTDGSFSKETGRAGFGWVIQSLGEDDHYVSSQSEEINELVNSPSLYAEFMAAVLAMERLPEKSKVVLHTDEENVHLFFSTTKQGRDNILQEFPKSKVKEALVKAHQGIDRHLVVESVHVNHNRPSSYEEMRMMTMTHNAAASGSGANSFKKMPKMIGTYAPHNRHDSSDALSVIDFGEEPEISERLKTGPMPVIF
ncbi:MAG TPA: hypothetical protein PLK85_07005 [Alphaproteobacteria bacterium]|nr:hypothetical protein [Alphaproteobacteria bacterium]